jgi:hypothetical protein
VNSPAVDGDFCSPLAAVAVDAFETPAVAASGDIASVLRMRALAQVDDTIIRRISVYVIDFTDRVFPMNMEPREPMSAVGGSVNTDHVIAAGVQGAGFRSRGHASSRFAPIKKPRFRGVIEQFSELLRGEAELRFAQHAGDLSKRKRPSAGAGSGRGLGAYCLISSNSCGL